MHVADGRCLAEDDTTSAVISSRTARTQHIAIRETVTTTPTGDTRELQVPVVGIIDAT